MDPLIFVQKIFEFSDSKKEDYICVHNGNNLKWILPKNKKYAVPIIKNWRPYSIKNYIFWKVLKFLFFFNIPNILNNINIIKLSTSNLDWSNYGWKSKEKPIVSIYIGTRSKDQKIIIFLANKKSRSQKLIVKFPLESNAWELIKKEYLFLNFLKQIHPKVAPYPVVISSNKKYSVQTFFEGKPSSLELTDNHYRFLGNLVYQNKKIRLTNLKSYFERYISSNKKNLIENNLFEEADFLISKLDKEDSFPLAIVHGDFICWNIKKNKLGELRVYDWEYSKRYGLPFYDLYYYKFQAFLKLQKKIKVDYRKYLRYANLKNFKINNDIVLIVKSVAEVIVRNDLRNTSSKKYNLKELELL